MNLIFSSVLKKTEIFTSKFVNRIISLKSRPRIIDGVNEEVYLDLISLNSSVSSAFLWVCLIGVLQLSAINNNISSVSVFRSKLVYVHLRPLKVAQLASHPPLLCFFCWQVKYKISQLNSTGLLSPASEWNASEKKTDIFHLFKKFNSW